jgi:hypothetical protein
MGLHSRFASVIPSDMDTTFIVITQYHGTILNILVIHTIGTEVDIAVAIDFRTEHFCYNV